MSLYPNATRHFFVSPRIKQRKAHQSGSALKSHQFSAHAGQFDPNCRACNELKAKIKTEAA